MVVNVKIGVDILFKFCDVELVSKNVDDDG